MVEPDERTEFSWPAVSIIRATRGKNVLTTVSHQLKGDLWIRILLLVVMDMNTWIKQL